MTVEQVLLVRQAESDGQSLTERGQSHACKLAEHLSARPIGSVLTGDSVPMMETAQTIAQALEITPQADHRWREPSLGTLQGLTPEQLRQNYPQQAQAMAADFLDYTPPSGESRRSTQTRLSTAWQEMLNNATGPQVVIVSDAEAIRLLLLKLFTSDAAALMRIGFDSTSITTLTYGGMSWRITGLAATPHLGSA